MHMTFNTQAGSDPLEPTDELIAAAAKIPSWDVRLATVPVRAVAAV
jgi:hypothetical protein